MSETRKSYPSDVPDAEWEFLIPHLTLMREDAPQREHDLRDVFDALRWVVERSFGWLGRFRRLALDYERLTETLAGWHWLAFLTLILNKCTFESA